MESRIITPIFVFFQNFTHAQAGQTVIMIAQKKQTKTRKSLDKIKNNLENTRKNYHYYIVLPNNNPSLGADGLSAGTGKVIAGALLSLGSLLSCGFAHVSQGDRGPEQNGENRKSKKKIRRRRRRRRKQKKKKKHKK